MNTSISSRAVWCSAVAAALLLSGSALAAQTHGPRAVHRAHKVQKSVAPAATEKSETTLRDLPPKTTIRLPGDERTQPRFASLNVQLLDSRDEAAPSTDLCRHRIGPRNTIARCR